MDCDQKALDLTPADEPLLAAQRHNSIGVGLLAIYRFEGGLELLNRSIIHSLQAIEGTPHIDATRQEWREHRYNLAISLHDRYHGTKNEEDLMKSFAWLKEVVDDYGGDAHADADTLQQLASSCVDRPL